MHKAFYHPRLGGLLSIAAILTFASHGARAAAAPVNLLPNSQWEIMSAEGVGTKWNVEGAGTMAPVSFTGYSVGSNSVTVFVKGSTGELKVGDLIYLGSTSGIDPALLASWMRVTAVKANASFTVRCPHGLSPRVSSGGRAIPAAVAGTGAIGTGDAADGGWKKTTSMPIWREDNPVNLPPDAYYALAAHKDIGGPEAIWWEGPHDVTRFRSHTVSLGVWVYHKIHGGSGTWQAYIKTDGAGGRRVVSAAAPAVSGAYRWETVTFAVPADATYIQAGVLLNGAAGDTYYLADPVFAVASELDPSSYTKPQETLFPLVHISPADWINATLVFNAACGFGYCFGFDAYAETQGAIAPTVVHAFGELEGIDSGPVVRGPGGSRLMAWYDREAAPERSGGFLAQYAADVKSFSNSFDMPFDGTGHAVLVSGVADDSWYNVSLEFDGFYLQ
jgi:hypothetical protein